MMKRSKFSKHEIETAIKVLMDSRSVKSWVESEGKFLGVNFNTPEGKEFYERKSRKAAERMIQ